MQRTCPYCRQPTVYKKGKARRKHRVDQRYYCSCCQRSFVDNSSRNKTYTSEVIRDALCLYNQGYTFKETATTLNRRYKVNTTRSTIHRWNKEYQDVCTYSALRKTLMKQYGKDPLVSKTFEHHGLAYNFKYHTGKLRHLCKDLPALVSYIIRCQSGCPPFFSEIQNRCSQLQIQVHINTTTTPDHLICRRAALALRSSSSKNQRHPLVETFMLINDDVTIAVEVPVWLWEKNLRLSIAGHIDLIQVVQGYVYILDYKPDASAEKESHVASQLYLYASGLSFRTHIPLHQFRCAWFDDKDYYEFEPKKAQVRYLTDRPIKNNKPDIT